MKVEFSKLMKALEKIFGVNSTKANTKFYLSLYYNADNSYLFIN